MYLPAALLVFEDVLSPMEAVHSWDFGTDCDLFAGRRMNRDGTLGRSQRGGGGRCLETDCYEMGASMSDFALAWNCMLWIISMRKSSSWS